MQIAEAVFIHTMQPTINIQKAVDFILPSARRPRITQIINTENVNIEFYQHHENLLAHPYKTRLRIGKDEGRNKVVVKRKAANMNCRLNLK